MDRKLQPNAAASNTTAASSAGNAAGAGLVGATGIVYQAEQGQFGAQGYYLDAMSGGFFAAANVTRAASDAARVLPNGVYIPFGNAPYYAGAFPVTASTAIPGFPYYYEQQAPPSCLVPLSTTAANVTSVPYPFVGTPYYGSVVPVTAFANPAFPSGSGHPRIYSAAWSLSSEQAPLPAGATTTATPWTANIYSTNPSYVWHSPPTTIAAPTSAMDASRPTAANLFPFQAPSTVPASASNYYGVYANSTSASASTSTAFAYFNDPNHELPADDFLGRSARRFSHPISSSGSGTIPPPGSSYNLIGGGAGSGTTSSPGSSYNLIVHPLMQNLLEEEPEGIVPVAEPGGEKTVFCNYWSRGMCSAGEHCRFAHTMDELRVYRPAPGRYRTKLCKNWDGNPGSCPYGTFCLFAHGVEELQPRGRRR